MKKMNVLEVNNIDLPGRRFNGYDIQKLLNQKDEFNCKQIVVYKQSEDDNVIKFFDDDVTYDFFHKLMGFENSLSIHSNLSITSPALQKKDCYKQADIVHFHMYHNTRISLYSFIKVCKKKKVILTFHDPWPITGRCVHYGDCNEWKTGCLKCQYLDTLFPFKEDHCNEMWKLKQIVYHNINPDIIVHSKYMLDLVKQSPLTKHFKNVHFIPFGIDLDMFSNKITQKEARQKLNIEDNCIVIFFRNQFEFKGVKYIIDALKKLKTEKKIVILTCDGTGNLDELKEMYEIKELGLLDNSQLICAYNACDMFLMPSRGESFGMMAIEAMACSKPVIIFNNTALPSVTFAPECGVLVEDKNSHQLMEKIQYLIDNPKEREYRGNLGRKICEENYDINKYNNNLIELYRKIYNTNKEEIKKVIKNNEIHNKQEITAMENILNKFTKQEFNENSWQYKKLIYKCKEIDGIKIDYSNLDIQKKIDEYNTRLYKALYTQRNSTNNNIDYNKIKKVLFLFIKDRNEFKKRVKNKIKKIFK